MMNFFARNLSLLPRRTHHSSIFIFSSLLFSSSSVRKPSSKLSFIAGYLITSIGLSPEKAIEASKQICHIKTPSKPDAVLNFLKNIGLDEAGIRNAVFRKPILLCTQVDKTLKPKVRLLQQVMMQEGWGRLYEGLSPSLVGTAASQHSLNNSKRKAMPHDASPFPISKMNPYLDDSIQENIGEIKGSPVESPAPNSLHNRAHHIVPGAILSATDKLQEAIPFDNSTILITLVDEGQSFQGVILNKPIRWNSFENLDNGTEPIKPSPISYGGPVRAQGLPLVSLSRKPTEGYTKVIHGVYFGNPMITSMVIEGIKLVEGAWHLTDDPTESLNCQIAEFT